MQRDYAQRLSWNPWWPFQCEVRHYWYLCSHEKLKDMGCGSLIGFMDNAEYRSVTQHQDKAARDIAIGSKALGCFIGETSSRTSAASDSEEPEEKVLCMVKSTRFLVNGAGARPTLETESGEGGRGAA